MNTSARNSEAIDMHKSAVSLLQSGNIDKGIAELKKARKKHPQDIGLSADLAMALWQHKGIKAAENQFDKTIELAPNNAVILTNYAAYKIAGEEFSAAEKALLSALNLEPGLLQGHYHMGCLLHLTNRKELALKAFQQTVNLNKGFAPGWHALGKILVNDNHRRKEGLIALQKAINLDHKNLETWSLLIESLERLNLISEAEKALNDAWKIFPNNLSLSVLKLRLYRRSKQTDEALSFIDQLKNNINIDDPKNGPSIFYELGTLNDQINETDKALRYFALAKKAKKLTPTYKTIDKSKIVKEIEKQKDVFTKSFVSRYSAYEDLERSPIFLFGFPRSGTTLLEQILMSHKDVLVAPERPAVSNMYYQLLEQYGEDAYPSCLAEIPEEKLQELKLTYFNTHKEFLADLHSPVFIDKSPLSFLHAGLINRVFPNSRYLFCIRNPFDSVLSCYMQNFLLSDSTIQFLSLDDASRFYDKAFSLWETFSSLLELENYPIKYEDLVEDMESEVKKVMQFLEIEWDNNILNYRSDIQKRQINTPSYSQVNEKIHTGSVDRWLKYKESLEPNFKTLEHWAVKHGYTLNK